MTSALDITLLTLRVGGVATLALVPPGVALGYLLARVPFPGRALVRTLLCLPMVLPPVAIGLALLAVLARTAPVGSALDRLFGAPILLTWWAAAIASAVMALPLLVLAAERGFAAVPRRLEQVAATLGASRTRVFLRVSLPLAWPSICHGLLFAFARALGEFGATAQVAGHIPGQTETLALAIYARVQQFDDAGAWQLAMVSVALSLAATGAAEWTLRRRVP